MNPQFTKIGTYDGTETKSGDAFQVNIVKGNVEYIGCSTGIFILDITDKTAPALIRVYINEAFANIAGLAISADGNTLYAAGSTGKGVRSVEIIDVTDKANPSQISIFDLTNFGIGSPEFQNPLNQHLKLLNANTLLCLFQDNGTGYGLVGALDISTPSVPVALSNPIGGDTKTQSIKRMDVQIGTAKVHVRVQNTATTTAFTIVYDMTDPSNPSFLGVSANIGTNVVDASESGDGFAVNEAGIQYAVVFDNDLSNWRLAIFDASDPTSIVTRSITTLDIGGVVVSQLDISPLIALITTQATKGGNPGTHSYDITDPTAPVQIQTDAQTGFSLAFRTYPYFYLNDIANDLTYIYQFSPLATLLDPDHGSPAGGTTVTITGSGFVVGATTVTIGGTTIAAADVSVAEDGNSLTFVTPAHAVGAVDVTVTTTGGTSGALTYTYNVTASSGYLEKTSL